MKTITLDDIAYNRLHGWKTNPQESFSSVVKRVLPEAGTLGALLEFSRINHTDELAGNDILEASANDRSRVKTDPWK